MSSDLWDYGEAENSDAHDSGNEQGAEGRKRKRKKMYLEVDSEKNSPSPVHENTRTCVESSPQGLDKKIKPSVVDGPSISQRQLDKEEEPDVNEEARKQQMYLEACVHEFDEFLEEAKKSAENPEEIEDLLDGFDGTGEMKENLEDKSEHPEEEVASDSIILVCQDRNKNSAKVRIQPSESFESLFERYSKYAFEKGWANEKDKIKYYFDGEQIQTTDVPGELGCENQDTIDVHIITG